MISPEHTRIIKAIGSWKVIRLGDLHRVLKLPIGHSGLYKNIVRLEKAGLVTGQYFPGKGKYVGLTEKGSLLSPCGATFNPETANHDLVVTDTIFKLLEFENFTSANVGENGHLDLCPDGIIHAVKEGNRYRLALEVELSRKSRHRLLEKFAIYTKDSSLGNILYITNKKDLFDAYAKVLSGMESGVREAIILSWSDYLGTGNYDYRKAAYWYDGELVSFEALFGGGER